MVSFKSLDKSDHPMLLISNLLTLVCLVTATVNARKVSIAGPKGKLVKDFGHIACELKKVKQNTTKR